MAVNREWIEALVMRAQNDFLAAPALTLALPQASQRFGVDVDTCKAVLDVLVDTGVLAKTFAGAYQRRFPRRPGPAQHGVAHAA